MTDVRTVARAVSLTRVHKWGTESAVLLHLAAEPKPFGAVGSSYADIGRRLGLGDGEVSRAIRRLVKRGCVARSASKGWGRNGTAPNLYQVNHPKEWGLVPWRVDRREAMLHLEASFALDVREQDATSPRAWAREQRLLARAQLRAGYVTSARAQLRAGNANPGPRAAARGLEGAPPPNYSERLAIRRGETGGGGEGFTLSDRQRALVDAFFAGVPGLEELSGHPLRRLCRVADESNGELERICKLAQTMLGPDRWLDRITQLEAAMTATDEEAPKRPRSGRVQALEQSLAGARAAGDLELVAELETEIALASEHPSVTVGPCGSDSEP